MQQRIYIVTENATKKPRLVRAATPAQAIRHVTRSAFAVDVASQDEIVACVTDGIAVENAAPDTSTIPEESA